MWTALLIAYGLGVVTAIPLIVGLVLGILWVTSEKVPSESDEKQAQNGDTDKLNDKDRAESPTATTVGIEGKQLYTVTARKTFEPAPEPPTTTTTALTSSLRSLLSSQAATSSTSGSPAAKQQAQRIKDRYTLAIKQRTVYLYYDAACSEVFDVIDLSVGGWSVKISFPSEWDTSDIQEGELFAKRNAIHLSRSKGENEEEDHYYLFVPSLMQMESLYHNLLHITTPSLQHSIQRVFDPSHLAAFISQLDNISDPLPTRWLNAFVARILFTYYRTATMEEQIKLRINRKLSRLAGLRPSWLEGLEVKRVDVGCRPPMLSRPMLKNLTKEGEASIEMNLTYKGCVKITLSATARITLPSLPSLSLTQSKNTAPQAATLDSSPSTSSGNTYLTPLLLTVSLLSVNGNILLLIKPPPSNRIWWGYTSTPQMEIDVSPVVSERAVKWSVLLAWVRSKLKEVILESVVLPNMDDIPFFSTEDSDIRGGVWGSQYRGYESEEPAVSSVQQRLEGLLGEQDMKIPGGLASESSVPSSSASAPAPSTSTSSTDSKEKEKENVADVFSTPVRTAKSLSSFETSPPLGPSVEVPFVESSQSLPLPEPSTVTESLPSTPVHGATPNSVMKRRTWFGSVRRSLGGEETGAVFGSPSTERARTHSIGGSVDSTEKRWSLPPPSIPLPNDESDKETRDPSKDDAPQLDVRVQPATPAEMIGDVSSSLPLTDDKEKVQEPLSGATADQYQSGDEGGSSSTRSRRWSDASSASASSAQSQTSSLAAPSSRSVSPALSSSSRGGDTDRESDVEDVDKQTQSNTRLNSGGFLAGLRAKNLTGLKELRELREKDIKDVTGMLSAQAMGVVKKWGWRGREGQPMSQTPPPSEAGAAVAAEGAQPQPAAAGGSGQPYLSLRDRVRERTGSNVAAEHLATGPAESLRRASFGSAVSATSASGSELGRDFASGTESSPIAIPGSKSRSSSPHPSATSTGSSPGLAVPIYRSQPSAREMPRMTIPGIHRNHKGELMAISSENVDAVISPTSTPSKVPPPLPPRRAEPQPSTSSSSIATLMPADEIKPPSPEEPESPSGEMTPVPKDPVPSPPSSESEPEATSDQETPRAETGLNISPAQDTLKELVNNQTTAVY